VTGVNPEFLTVPNVPATISISSTLVVPTFLARDSVYGSLTGAVINWGDTTTGSCTVTSVTSLPSVQQVYCGTKTYTVGSRNYQVNTTVTSNSGSRVSASNLFVTEAINCGKWQVPTALYSNQAATFTFVTASGLTFVPVIVVTPTPGTVVSNGNPPATFSSSFTPTQAAGTSVTVSFIASGGTVGSPNYRQCISNVTQTYFVLAAVSKPTGAPPTQITNPYATVSFSVSNTQQATVTWPNQSPMACTVTGSSLSCPASAPVSPIGTYEVAFRLINTTNNLVTVLRVPAVYTS